MEIWGWFGVFLDFLEIDDGEWGIILEEFDCVR